MPFDPRIIAGHTLLAIVLATAAMAVPARAERLPTRPHTCLVLGGGGARGAAHIGVLKELEREHVPIDCIVGTSMGAIVGGLYAAGYSADQIDAILRGIDWKDLLEDNPPRGERSMRRKDDDLRFLGGVEIGIRNGRIALPQGMIQGQKLELLLRRLLLSTTKVGDFDHLPIPYRAIAADIATGDKVVFARGDLATAIRASMSIPGAFAPVRLDGRMLVDGGMVDNVPVDEARKLGAERLIVVSVGAPLAREDELDSPYTITYQMLGALMKRQTDAELASLGKDDLLIEPALGTIAAQDFHRVGEARDIGQAAATTLRSRIEAFAATDAEYAAFERKHHPLPFDAPIIAFLDVARDQSRTADYVGHRLGDSVGQPLDIDAIEKNIGIAYGEGRYQSIRWQLAERDGQTGIHLEPQDKAWGPDFLRSSLRLSDDFSGNSSYQLLSELNLTGLNSQGGELRGRVGFGRLSNLHAEYYQPWGDAGQYWVSPYVDYRAYNIPVAATNRITYGEYRRSRGVTGGEFGFTPDNQWQLSTRFEYGFDRAHLRIGDPDLLPNFSSHIGGVVLRATRDTLDSSGFPSSGTRLDLSYEAFLTALGSDDNARVTQFSWDNAYAYGANRWLFGLKGSWSSGGENLLATYSPLGGLTNLSGYAENTILASRTALARAIYYRQLTNTQGLLSVPVYAGASLELGMYGDSRAELTHRGPVTAGSIFLGVDTFLGPIFLGYGQAEGGVRAFYLTFGPLLRTETGY